MEKGIVVYLDKYDKLTDGRFVANVRMKSGAMGYIGPSNFSIPTRTWFSHQEKQYGDAYLILLRHGGIEKCPALRSTELEIRSLPARAGIAAGGSFAN